MIVDARFKETSQEEIDLEDDADEIERAFLDEFGINDSLHTYHARIYRVVNGQQSFIEQVGTDAFPIEERLRDRHKGGHFRAIIFKDDKIWKNKTYRIEKPIEPNAVAPSQIADITELVRQQNEQMAAIMKGQTPGAVGDPMQTAIAMVTAMGTMMNSMKETFAPQKQGSDLETFIKAFELAQSMQTDNSGGKGVMDVLSDFVRSDIGKEVAGRLRLEQPQPRAPKLLTAQPVPGFEGAPAATNIPQPEEQTPPPALVGVDAAMIDQLRGQIAYWVQRAKAGSDPALYAELAVDNYPPEFLGPLILRPDLREIAISLIPDVASYWPWFQELQAEINHILTDDGEGEKDTPETTPGGVSVPIAEQPSAPVRPDENPGRRGGNTRDAGNNANTDKAGTTKPKGKTKGSRAN